MFLIQEGSGLVGGDFGFKFFNFDSYFVLIHPFRVHLDPLFGFSSVFARFTQLSAFLRGQKYRTRESFFEEGRESKALRISHHERRSNKPAAITRFRRKEDLRFA